MKKNVSTATNVSDAFFTGNEGASFNSFGAHKTKQDGKEGYSFVLWAPFAKSVRVVGSFSGWNEDDYAMLPLGDNGVWHLFIEGVKEGDMYKYLVETRAGEKNYKADPYAFYAQQPPETASVIFDTDNYKWGDRAWLSKRKKQGHLNRPLNIYEVHLGSWKRNKDGSYYTYAQLAEELVPYAVEMGYTHLEFMPVMEHPFDGSWGYQTTGYFAPTSRYGTPTEFMALIDACHQAGLGVILDWVPGHFCRDVHGLANFTGEKLYEEGDHAQWGTYNFNFNRGEVRSFLLSSALFWIEKYHADGLRVDGVTSMIYLNFGVDNPHIKRYNENGTEENLPAIEFIKNMNKTVGTLHPDVMMIAEESSAWPLVTYPPEDGGLGFHYKWDMGWMHDTLNYMKTDFPYRPSNHRLLTFSMMYAFNENFILALSHDEVVHGKCSLIERMPGDYWRQFAGLRTLALYQMCHSGAKHNFMGSEIAQFIEWRYYEGMEWFLLDYEAHAKQQRFIKALNHLYAEEKALWQVDHSWKGFEWIEADDSKQSIIYFERHGEKADDDLMVLINFVPETNNAFRIGVPKSGAYKEIFNSDAAEFGGSGRVNAAVMNSEPVPWQGQENSIVIMTPPIGGLILKRVPDKKTPAKRKPKAEAEPEDAADTNTTEPSASPKTKSKKTAANKPAANKPAAKKTAAKKTTAEKPKASKTAEAKEKAVKKAAPKKPASKPTKKSETQTLEGKAPAKRGRPKKEKESADK